MKTESRIFNLVAVFLAIAAVVYGWWTHASTGHVEVIGVVALILSMLLLFMCGFYFAFIARRMEPRPEDREDAEIAEGAGEIGFFSPGSYWPFGLALAAAVAGIGVVFWQVWLLIAGLVAVVLAVCGFVFEYYTGTRRVHGHD
ncbi:cytochrome c oxidase subunit 4 [Actinocatenispora rupis]|uniref:Cytochrome c oxidase polypeptide 4 n=1 Tax=Actinocatenispora rupis TaxID=519421 RepID=A0A8J3NDY3_9ACTN|nr:cytochrome c oxidase subunit 4 [Actinocatenispora rupis]GID13462.1 cytochrome c oxidase polypeptide 4 [Actinocatenispora rupis]